MTRDLRFRFTGIVFFITFAAAMLLSEELPGMVQAQLAKGGSNEVVVAAIGAAAALFMSEGAGFMISSLWMFTWYMRAGKDISFSGYSSMWSKLAYDIKQEVIDTSTPSTDAAPQSKTGQAVWRRRLHKYSPDVYLSYFWQRAPAQLVRWVSRRVTTYLICMSACTATAVAVGMSSLIILLLGLGWTQWNWVLVLVAAALATVFCFNGRVSYREGFQMLELWQTAMFEPELRSALAQLAKQSAQSEACDASRESIVKGQSERDNGGCK